MVGSQMEDERPQSQAQGPVRRGLVTVKAVLPRVMVGGAGGRVLRGCRPGSRWPGWGCPGLRPTENAWSPVIQALSLPPTDSLPPFLSAAFARESLFVSIFL